MCHALARDTSNADVIPRPCIYCQLDDPNDELHEVWFVPEDDPATLDDMFAAFTYSASLNPDPVEEDEGNFYYNEDEVGHASNAVPGQFDDAEG